MCVMQKAVSKLSSVAGACSWIYTQCKLRTDVPDAGNSCLTETLHNCTCHFSVVPHC